MTSTLRQLLSQKIRALYDIESELTKALPKMAEAAEDDALKEGFESHLRETEGQVERLEKIFEVLGEEPEKLEVEAIRGLAKDGEWVIENVEEGPARDLALASSARYAEHYEMAGYMAAREMAMLLGEKEVSDLLSETLEEEKMADEKLEKAAKNLGEKLLKD